MPDDHSYLRRLPEAYYRSLAMVHWTMTIDKRERGWLTPDLHRSFRETLIHTCARYDLLCPAYCLMPDHFHLLLMGVDDSPEGSDQLKASSFFRRYLNERLAPIELQKQGHDHVLQEHERERDAFESVLYYITANPERGDLVSEGQSREWPYSGSIAAGYPNFDWRGDGFSETLWKVYHAEVSKRASSDSVGT